MMAEKSDQPSVTFGPEWLSFSQQPGDDTSRYSNPHHHLSSGTNAPIRPHAFYSSKDKERIPLRFVGRSKSSPLIVDPEGRPSSDVFTMLKERNTFDRNFPTLNTRKSKPPPGIVPLIPSHSTPHSSNGSSPLSQSTPSPGIPTPSPPPPVTPAWKQGSNSPPVSSPTQHLSGPSSPNSLPTSASADKEKSSLEDPIQKESFLILVPNVTPKVVTKRVELVAPKKNKLNEAPKTKPKFDPSFFRKAVSESSLPLTKEEMSKYEINKPKPKAAAPANKNGTVVPNAPKPNIKIIGNRDDFFHQLLKKEQPRKEDAHSNESGEANGDTTDERKYVLLSRPSAMHDQRTSSMARNGSAHGNDGKDSGNESNESNGSLGDAHLSPASLEDEERFLRDLGWVPEEEAHVPELTEEEILYYKKIAESNKLLQKQKQQQKQISLDLSIKKWQHDKFSLPLSTS